MQGTPHIGCHSCPWSAPALTATLRSAAGRAEARPGPLPLAFPAHTPPSTIDNMAFSRLIPCLLLKGRGLYKTVRFKNPKYVGDPLNAVRIFNEKGVDELILLDIEATREGRGPNFELLADLAGEAFVPLCYGGGVTELRHFERLFYLGIEKVSLNSSLFSHPGLLEEAAKHFGEQSVVASVDARRRAFGSYEVVTHGGTRRERVDPRTAAVAAEQRGAGEVVINAVDRDGMMKGMDIPLIRTVSEALTIPVVAIGGAGNLDHAREGLNEGHASAVAAGSMFVFSGPHRAVLITYPAESDVSRLSMDARGTTRE